MAGPRAPVPHPGRALAGARAAQRARPASRSATSSPRRWPTSSTSTTRRSSRSRPSARSSRGLRGRGPHRHAARARRLRARDVRGPRRRDGRARRRLLPGPRRRRAPPRRRRRAQPVRDDHPLRARTGRVDDPGVRRTSTRSAPRSTACATPSNHFFAFRVDGHVPDAARARRVQGPGGHAARRRDRSCRREWNLEDVRGTLVGFWSPAYAAHFDVPGYHFHVVDEARERGGHVLGVLDRRARGRGRNGSSSSSSRSPRPPTSSSTNLARRPVAGPRRRRTRPLTHRHPFWRQTTGTVRFA